MPTIAELKAAADERLFSQDFEAALPLYMQLVLAQPLNLDARLRVADTLLGLGEAQRAAVVYTRLAQYASPAGYPLRALVALKMLTALEPTLQPLVHSVSELYGRDSTRLGRGARRSLPDDGESLPRGSLPPTGQRADLLAEAERLAADFAVKDALLPDKLMPIPLLSQLDKDSLARVFDCSSLVRVRPGARVVEQGAEGGSMFVLARGTVRVERAGADGVPRELATLREGAVFGELSLLSDAPRNASVTAVTDCDLLELSLSALRDTGPAAAQLVAAVSAFAHERLLSHVMASSPMFAALDPSQRSDLIKRFVEIEVPRGDRVITQGEQSPGAYVVLRGEVVVSHVQDARSTELARLAPGDLFGEMSLLTGDGASANVDATQPSVLLFLAKPYFERLLAAVPELRVEIERLAGRRSLEITRSVAPLEDDGIEVEVLL
ncbi:MAG: cyclic nucleotide-binding domain-containing protein [Polyangiales bacterium]